MRRPQLGGPGACVGCRREFPCSRSTKNHLRFCTGADYVNRRAARTAESWHTGRYRRNRVTVRMFSDGVVRVEWYEGGKHLAQYGFPRGEITGAIKDVARAKARDLMPARSTYQPAEVLMAMRRDLLRVARLEGRPDGYAPNRDLYNERGQWSPFAIAAAFLGYRKNHGGPLEGWKSAIHKFGLKPASEARFSTHVQIVQDLFRVARLLGKPHTLPGEHAYKRDGKHGAHTVMRSVGVERWTELGPKLGLMVPEWRLAARDRAMGNRLARRANERRINPAPRVRGGVQEAAA